MRRERLLRVGGKYVFQFTHPVWGATTVRAIKAIDVRFQFTHPVWGATEPSQSIHIGIGVSIHAPRVGCDQRYIEQGLFELKFQFTHPVWGATIAKQREEEQSKFQFTHPVWGAT